MPGYGWGSAIGAGILGGLNTYNHAKDSQLERKKLDMEMQRAELDRQRIQEALDWQRLQHTQDALGPEAAFNNPGYVAQLEKLTGATLPRGLSAGMIGSGGMDMAGGGNASPMDIASAGGSTAPQTGVQIPAGAQVAGMKNKAEMAQARQTMAMSDWLASMGTPGQPGPGGAGFDPKDPRTRIMVSSLPGMRADEILGPAEEPLVKVTEADPSGNLVDSYKSRDEVRGKSFPIAPTGEQKTKLADVKIARDSINTIIGSMNKSNDWQQWIGPVNGRLNSLKAKMPAIGPFAGPVDSNYTAFKNNIYHVKNAFIHAMTGAAMSAPEAERLASELFDENNRPEVFSENMRQVLNHLGSAEKAISQGQIQSASPTVPSPSTAAAAPMKPKGPASMADITAFAAAKGLDPNTVAKQLAAQGLPIVK